MDKMKQRRRPQTAKDGCIVNPLSTIDILGTFFRKQVLPRNFRYGNYMKLKIYGMKCYATLAGETELVIVLNDNQT